MIAMPEMLQTIARGSAEQMALTLAGGSAIAACTWAGLRAIPRQQSRTRFALWFGVLASIAMMPAIGPLVRGIASGSAGPGATAAAWIVVPESWALYGFIAWAIAASIGLARVAGGVVQLRRLKKNCEEVRPEEWNDAVRSALAEIRSTRAAKICVSDELRVPTALGFVNPVVAIPRTLLAELSADELHQICLHEVAHLERWDDWTNLAQKVVKALLFFHPAVWWVEKQISLEREMACDEAVIARTQKPRAYAECLAMLAEKGMGRRGAALAQALVSRVRQTTQRVAEILSGTHAQGRSGWTLAAATVPVIVFGATLLAGSKEQLIGFTTATTHASTVATANATPSANEIANEIPMAHAVALKTQAVAKRPVARAAKNKMSRPQGDAVYSANSIPASVMAQLAKMESEQNTPAAPGDPVVLTIVSQRSQADASGEQSWSVQITQMTVFVPRAKSLQSTPQKKT